MVALGTVNPSVKVRIFALPPKMQAVKVKKRQCSSCGAELKKTPKCVSKGREYCYECFLLIGDWD